MRKLLRIGLIVPKVVLSSFINAPEMDEEVCGHYTDKQGIRHESERFPVIESESPAATVTKSIVELKEEFHKAPGALGNFVLAEQ